MLKYFAVMIFSGMLSSFSQVLLKKSAMSKKNSVIKEYLNPYVIIGYAITALCMVLTMLGYRGVPFKYGAVLESLAYIYIMILSRLLLHEELTKRKVLGNLVIVIGVIVFSIGR